MTNRKAHSPSKPFSYREFRSIYSRVPRLTVEVVIRTPEGIVLTLRKKYGWKNQWHMPGATLLYGEKVQDAAVRVAREEAGLEVHVERLLGLLHYPSEKKERGFGWAVGAIFLCSIVSGELKADDQASAIRFFRRLPRNIVKDQRAILESVL
jgi:ADP-ribose pyrophosphatase YjhB (NUDIX family)